MTIDAVHDRKLVDGPEAQMTPTLYREAWPGEVCLFCEREFKRGEVVDGLFWYGAHPGCFEAFIQEIDDDGKNVERNTD